MSAHAPGPPRGRTPQNRNRLRVLLGTQSDRAPTDGEQTLDLDAFAGLVRSGRILRELRRYEEVIAVAPNADVIPRPFAVSLCLKLMARGSAWIASDGGVLREITWRSCSSAAARMAADRLALPRMRRIVETRLAALERLTPGPGVAPLRTGRVLHVRSDLWLGVKAGGSVAHTAGIANALAEAGREPLLLTFERNPILDPAVVEYMMPLPERFWDSPEAPQIAANLVLEAEVARHIDEARPSMVYHRLAAFSFGAALAAKSRQLPLIVEYNGSEAWIARNWGRPFRNRELAQRIENAVLAAADRIVVVSKPLQNELLQQGLPAERIRVVMNGVDPRRFHPDLDGRVTRVRHGISGDTIVYGFIGSFGRWHGVPVLVEAFAQLREMQLGLPMHLLLIGDGPERAQVEARIAALGLGDHVTLTGLVAQAEAPAVLAASDVLIVPTVRNPDGSAFFGSPTKLFEYMALGRCIIASDIDQVGEVLLDGVTALLVPPGDRSALAKVMARAALAPDLRLDLGTAARADALRKHKWITRLNSIID